MRTSYVAITLSALLVSSLVLADVAPKSAALLKTADQVTKKTAALRGLRVKRKIKKGVMGKAELKKRLLKRVDQEYSPAELANEELMLKRYGFISPNEKYLELVIDLLTDQIAGFYDPWEQQLYIADFQSIGGDMVMSHEVTHALQDQHFNLRKFMKAAKKNGDASLARQALVEGDGMAVMIEYMLKDLGQPAPWGQPQLISKMSSMMSSTVAGSSLKDAPLILQMGLLFPYLNGLEFVAHFRRTLPWKRVDKLYKKPPLSTEQVLHPKKYESYERPIVIKSSALEGLAVKKDDVMGEFGLYVLLRQHGVADAKAKLASAGWGGDRTAVLSKAKVASLSDTVGVSMSAWDHEADAIEFFKAAGDALASLSGGKLASSTATRITYVNGSRLSSVERRGDKVLLTIAVQKALAKKLEAGAWKSWKAKK
jgi:hypothetical protein